jgi:23S rRNA (adenine2503-C2)-methyltransferase
VDLELLERTLADRGEPPYRAQQVWQWTARGAHGYDEMTDLPAALREALATEVPLSSLQLKQQAQAKDKTIKALFETSDGRPVEAVLMRYRDGRNSLCLSSQSGCPLTCTFCATGAMKFGRNLTASEILDQALHFRRIQPVDHAVFMGMGEPMMNLDAVLGACERLPDLGIINRRTAISPSAGCPASSGSRAATPRSGWRSRSTRPKTRCARSSCRSTTATRSTRCSPHASSGGSTSG